MPKYITGHNSRVTHPTAGNGKSQIAIREGGPYFCACGCGGEIKPTKNGSRIAKYLPNHDKRGKGKTRKTYPVKFCGCGCGRQIKPNSRRQLSDFLPGHNSKTAKHLALINKIGLGTKTGPDHPNWKGGTSEEHDRYYYTKAWSDLRRQCFERDHFTCQQCGKKRNLKAHHVIERRAGGPDTLENLTTLCHICHVKLHNNLAITNRAG